MKKILALNIMTYKEEFLKKYHLPPTAHLSLDQISKLTGIKKSILEEVEKRGAGAWKNNLASVRLKESFEKNPNTKLYPRSDRLGQAQWARARVYSFVMKGKTFYTADSDLARQIM